MKRHKWNTFDKILLVLLITILAFVITVLIFNAKGMFVQDSLIQLFLGLCATELATMGGIKMFKTKHEDKRDGDYND